MLPCGDHCAAEVRQPSPGLARPSRQQTAAQRDLEQRAVAAPGLGAIKTRSSDGCVCTLLTICTSDSDMASDLAVLTDHEVAVSTRPGVGLPDVRLRGIWQACCCDCDIEGATCDWFWSSSCRHPPVES